MHQLRRVSRGRAATRAIVAAALASAPATARADMFAPPIPVVDFFYLGLPLGPIIGLGVIAATVAVFVALRRRKVHAGLAILAAGLLFLVGDCTAYVVGIQQSSRSRRERRERYERDQPPAATPSSSAVPSPAATGSAR